MTARTYTNAEIVWPDGERTRVSSMRVEFRDAEPQDAPSPLAFGGEVRFESFFMSRTDYEDLVRVFPRVCWKCHDGRTRSHNRRCPRRGHRRRTEQP